MPVTTKTDPTAQEWTIDDEVVRLRAWGTDQVHMLPAPPIDEWLVGTDETKCAIPVVDPLASREHARLTRYQAKWWIRDLRSKNGLWLDGARREHFSLEPGLEIRIGNTSLIAESSRLIALRTFLCRILGWTSDRADAVDHALRSIRIAATRRAPLVISGETDLVSIAHAIHRHTLPADRPFVACDPRRKEADESVRSVANHPRGLIAFEAATGGSLCAWSSRLPGDFPKVLVRLRQPASRVQLIMCSRDLDDRSAYIAAPIEVPPLKSRSNEVRRIVDEYTLDALAELEARRESFTSLDRAWVLEHAVSSLSEIETATLRIVALRTFGNINRAATRLGMTHVSLARWIERRGLPMRVEP